MNFLEDEENVQRSKKTKMIIITIAIIIVILIIICGVLIYQIGNIENSTLKLVLNSQNTQFDSSMFIIENGTLYISIKDFAELLGYRTFNGDYKTKYSEDVTNCYISTVDEVASFSLNSATMYKQVQQQEMNAEPYDYEYFDLDQPVQLRNGKLYATADGMEIGTNSLITYSESNNTITVVTLDSIISVYASSFPNAAINDEDALFNNKKALRYDLVVTKSEDEHYGVYNSEGQEIIGEKYASIEFMEGSSEFTVTTDEGKMGILASDGRTKIEPNYTEIKQISKDLNYYLVKNNEKYGVINQNGNIVIYLEFDQIGIDEEEFASNDIDNPYILFDNCIPVMQNDRWGVFDINGQQLIPVEYSEMGCINGTTTDRVSNNVVIIPEFESIVLGNDDKYAIFSSLGEMYVPLILDSVYSITTSGEDQFYMTFTIEEPGENGTTVERQQTYDLAQYFEEHVVTTVQEPQIQNTITNETVIDPNSVEVTDTVDPNAGVTTDPNAIQPAA